MYAIAIIRFRKPLEQVLPHVDEHRAYLRDLQQKDILLVSGPFEPRSGGALVLKVPDENAHEVLDQIRDGDPFTKYGDAQYELLMWSPTVGKEWMDR